MAEFNLIDEPWISVMTSQKGDTKEVSLSDLFEHAHEYIDLAGDSVTQDFAVLRVLLAVLHTVFSRYDAEGDVYDEIEVDEDMQQIDSDIDDYEDFSDKLLETWKSLWSAKAFPKVLFDYLTVWHDRFYLFDDEYPFYQARAEDIAVEKISRKNPGLVTAKTINRLISESGNKVALFSPRQESHKEILTAPEVARWLIMFQGYTGLSDKTIFGNSDNKYKASKGWLFDIGGIYLKGRNLFETLMLNLVLVHPREQFNEESQKPCWEFTSDEWIERYFSIGDVDNLAELYTNWSRAIYIDPNIDLNKKFSFSIVKIPEINHVENFLEPMTMWRLNRSGENKDRFTPRKHQAEQSMWRSFGLITMPDTFEETQSRPEIMKWLEGIREDIGEFDLQIQSVSMKDDGNATSWMPVGEIHDSLRINDLVLTDTKKEGWIIRITAVVEDTKKVIEQTYRAFMADIVAIRGFNSHPDFISRQVEEVFYEVDQPFREWLSSIRPTDDGAEVSNRWKKQLLKIVNRQADKVLESATNRDYVGISKEVNKKDIQENIITAYNRFKYFLNKD